jgi:hypothetical protein
MTAILLGILTLTCLLILLDGLRRNRPYELPFLAAATTVTFVLPQLIGLYRSPLQPLPDVALSKTFVMAWLCIVMLRLGWQKGRAAGPFGPIHSSFHHWKLVNWAALLAVVGAWGNWEIRSLPEEMTKAIAWRGLPVAYLFFAVALTYGYALSVNLWLRNRAKTALAVIAVACFVYFSVIVFGGRRQPAAEFVLIPASLLWFIRKRALPRIAPIIGIVGMLLILPSTGDYRAVAAASEHQDNWGRFGDIPFLGNLQSTLRYGGPELTNAVMRIEAVDRSMLLDFGLSFWNAMVFAYVPRQIVGQEFKQSLMISLPDPEYVTFGYVPIPGSTWTGFATAFASFWYLGCLIFFLVAWVMGRLYRRALNGDLIAQVVYALMLVQSALVITHSTSAFVTPWPHIALFLLTGLHWAKKRSVSGPVRVGWPGRPVKASR